MINETAFDAAGFVIVLRTYLSRVGVKIIASASPPMRLTLLKSSFTSPFARAVSANIRIITIKQMSIGTRTKFIIVSPVKVLNEVPNTAKKFSARVLAAKLSTYKSAR